MVFINLRVVFAAVTLAVLANAATQPTKVGLGGNLDWFCGTCDYYGAAVFVNALKQSRTFGHYGQAWVTDGFSYNSIGLPIGQQKFSTFLFDSFTKPIADTAGTWTVRITGADVIVTANNQFRCCSAATNLKYNATTKVTTANFNCPATCTNVDMDFEIKDMSQTITNMEVIRPGYPIDNYPMYTTSYLNFQRGLNTFRFMDWAQTNGQTITEWSQRSTLNNLQFTNGKGIPWEAAIELANNVGSNVWVNIPSNATEDYMLQMAKLFRTTLDSNLIVYLEFSNEPWNNGFTVTQDSFRIGQALYATGNYDFLDFDRSGNIWYMGYRWTVWRGYVASNIWRTVYGDAAMMTTVRPVINSQYTWTIWATVGLQMIDAAFGPPSKFFYALAVAPYFGMRNQSLDSTVDQVWQQMDYGSQDIFNSMSDNLFIARRYGLEVMCYEGGAEIPSGGNSAVKKLVNLDPRMEGTIVRYLQTMWTSGVRLFNYYFVGVNEFGGGNDWGVVDSILNATAQPKYKALKTVLALNKADNEYAYKPAPKTDVITTPVWSFVPQSEQGWPTSWDTGRWNSWTHMLGELSANGANYDLQFEYQISTAINVNVTINNKVVCSFVLPGSSVRVNRTVCSLQTVPKVNVFFLSIAPATPGSIWFVRLVKKSDVTTSFKWVPLSYPPTSATVCAGPVNENSVASLQCPSGQVVSSVAFASFGNPTGSCSTGFKTSTCNSANSISAVQTACVGKNSCSLGASNGNFGGDPCVGTYKQLAIQLSCATPTSLCASVGEGQYASVYCPKGQKVASVDFASFGTATGTCGNYATGTCNAATSLSYAQAQCVGRSSCSIGASNGVFGDPCSGTVKRFTLQVTCM